METTEHELDISTHDLARRSTVPHDPETGLLIISTHDLTRRSTKSNASTILNGVNFNSRSHKEVDFHARRCVLCRICISTHDLTKRSTRIVFATVFFFDVSTHDLTKRSTVCTSVGSLSETFQLTTSRRGRRKHCRTALLMLTFQLTTSS